MEEFMKKINLQRLDANRGHEPVLAWSADSHVRSFRNERFCGQSCPRSGQEFSRTLKPNLDHCIRHPASGIRHPAHFGNGHRVP